MALIAYLLVGTLFLYAPDALAAQTCTRGFSVVAPEVAAPGRVTAVLVTLHGVARLQPLNVTLRLLSDSVVEATQLLTEVTQEIRGQGIVPLAIPVDVIGRALLHTLVNCSQSEDCDGLQSTSELQFVGSVRDVVIRANKKLYAPGDTVLFWILALDHDLQVASEIIARVFVLDPAGNKVAIWDEVPLDEGVKSFTIALSSGAQIGKWQLLVAVQDEVFRAKFNVSLMGDDEDQVPEVAMAEEHYVELKFSHEMRRVYKPGLPFLGKVEAMSTEKSVRVRVKVYDNTTAIYSQDIEISSGEGRFVVPAILADSETIILQAELVSVEGKEIDSHYVLAKEPIKKWNSTSDCYLLIEGIDYSLTPDEEYRATVLSTCPCEVDMNYVITTGGHVTYWNQWRKNDAQEKSAVKSAVVDSTAFCRLNFSFTVQAVMAPISNLLVYYVTEEGEPISDVVIFDVNLLHKQISLSVEERDYWLPSESMKVGISSSTSSFVCLIGGRSGVDAKIQPAIVHAKKQNHGMDFLTAGVTFYQRQCENIDNRTEFYRHDGKTNSWRHNSLVSETELEQLWMWQCYNYSDDMIGKGVTISAPKEPGKWTLWALTLSPNTGLRFSAPQSLTIFRPLQVALLLPPNLRVGESVQVDVRVTNNVATCVDVTALLSISEGAHFLSSHALYVTEKLRLGPRGATSLVVRVVVTTPGFKNMTVEVSGYGSETCREPGSNVHNNTLIGTTSRTVSTLVHPEGQVRTDTESAYFCANENVVISTSESFRFEWVSAPRNRQGVVFEVKVGQGAHIALSEVGVVSEKMYQVVIGDESNTVTWVGRGKHGFGVHLTSIYNTGLLSSDEFRTFWISWDRGTVALGRGPHISIDTLLKWRVDKKLKVQHIGFASAWGSVAEFRVWNYNDEAGFSQVLHLDVPRSVVPGTEQGTLMIAGGLALPSAVNHPTLGEAASLIPSVASFTPLLIPRDPSNTTGQSAALSLRLQNLMSFRKSDNSFGDHHKFGSHHSTVSILELLTRTQTYLSVDPDMINGMKHWLQQRQTLDGSFTPLPEDSVPGKESLNNISSSSKLNHDVETTAETVSALLDVGLESEKDSETLLKARYFLERSLFRVTEPCPLALMTYALVLSKSELTHVALDRLKNASTNEEGDFCWPHPSANKDNPNWLYEESSSRHNKEPIRTSVGEYKAALYALMTYSILGDLKSAEPIARFLFYRSHLLDKHSELLYNAVKAFAAFGSLAYDRHRSLTVSLATSGMELTDTLELRPESSPQTLQLPSLPTKVFVYATGAGCATVQGQVSYSSYAPTRRTPLLELWASIEDEVGPSHNSLDELEGKLPTLLLKTCFSWRGRRPSGVLRLEVTLFSGFELVDVLPVEPGSREQMADMSYGSRNNQAWFIIANVSSSCALCFRYTAKSVHVVGSLRPAFARIFPVHRVDLAAEMFFHTQRGSPLLADVTDDDLITWFGRADSDRLELSSNFSDICECGKTCIKQETNTTEKVVEATTQYNEESTQMINTTQITEDSVQLSEKLDVQIINGTVMTVDVNTMSNVNESKEVVATDVLTTAATEEQTKSAQSHSINKEKNHPILPTTDTPDVKPHKLSSDKLFVVDRDTLWGMLREVVHVEMNKKQPKDKSGKNKNNLN